MIRSKTVGAAPTVVASSPASNPANCMSAPGPFAEPSHAASRSSAARAVASSSGSPCSSSSIGRKCRARKSCEEFRRSSSTRSSKVQSSRAVMVSWSVAMRSSIPAGVDVSDWPPPAPSQPRAGRLFQLATQPRAGSTTCGRSVVGSGAPLSYSPVPGVGRRRSTPSALARCTPGCHQPMCPNASAQPMFSFHVRSSIEAMMSSAVRARIHCSTPWMVSVSRSRMCHW